MRKSILTGWNQAFSCPEAARDVAAVPDEWSRAIGVPASSPYLSYSMEHMMHWDHKLGRIVFLAGALMVAFAAPAAHAQSFETPAPVSLPKDEAPHHSQEEWWYFVGHLKGVDPSGKEREFGYEVTVFQTWPIPSGEANYTWHFAVTDVTNKRFQSEERVSSADIPRQLDSFSFTNADWSVAGSAQNYAIKAKLGDDRYGIDLQTSSDQPFVLHNGNGVVPYMPLSDTSAYYSSTALHTTGTIYDNGVPIKVTGISWQDRQWFNFKNTGGWNWFAIQLDNNTQYMLYFLQNFPAGDIVLRYGTKVTNGVATPVDPNTLSLTVLDHWTSPKTLYTYPSKWQIGLPEGTMTVTPLVQNQELSWPGHRTYFEGDSAIAGTLDGRPVTGRGYTEVNPAFEPLSSLP
ncbi:carotenoid 1,2-hydratase [Burkholderia glumae]|uniref:carotenoid 1,2-hydratase n=1 Tax=Burkholderia glumae TaxID=337 RepID=UPI0020B44D50|nr:carotenoid 1,2-hydratase [Burkholderia glumae]